MVNNSPVDANGNPIDNLEISTDGSVASTAGNQILVTGSYSTYLELARFNGGPLNLPSRPFVIQSDGQVYTQPLSGSGTYTGPYALTAPKATKDIQAVKLGNGSAMVFAIGSDNQVYDETIAPDGTTGGYQLAAYGSVASMSAGTDANGNPILFAVGTDKQLYEQTLNPNGTPSSGSFTKAAYGYFQQAFLTHDANGNPLLYATGYYASSVYVYVLQLTAAGAPNGSLHQMGTGAVTQISVGHNASNAPEIFVRGTDGYAYSFMANATGLPASREASLYLCRRAGRLDRRGKRRERQPSTLRCGE